MKRKPVQYYMRALHRDVGFFVIGLTLIFSLSGIVLIYRDSDFLKQETKVEKTLATGLEPSEVGNELHLRNFRLISSNGEIIQFQNGTYNKKTGIAVYTIKALPSFLNVLANLHKASSRNVLHWISLTYGLSLMFLAISSFWMFKPKSKMFRRGLCFAALGVGLSILVLML